jgi:hypothetical protein
MLGPRTKSCGMMSKGWKCVQLPLRIAIRRDSCWSLPVHLRIQLTVCRLESAVSGQAQKPTRRGLCTLCSITLPCAPCSSPPFTSLFSWLVPLCQLRRSAATTAASTAAPPPRSAPTSVRGCPRMIVRAFSVLRPTTLATTSTHLCPTRTEFVAAPPATACALPTALDLGETGTWTLLICVG